VFELHYACMGRGRPQSVSDDRLLIELLIHPDRGVFTSELADELGVVNQTIRDRMKDLQNDGLICTTELKGGNLYRLSEDGNDYLKDLLRSDYQ